MSSCERLSPMTLYYLRRLIHSKRTELSIQSPRGEVEGNLDQFLTQLNDLDFNGGISARVLEQLITLHQSLAETHSSANTQIEGIEAQIYNMLSLSWTQQEKYSRQKLGNLSQFSPQKCREIIKTLYCMKQKYESLASPKIVQNYLIKSCPHLDENKPGVNQVALVRSALDDKPIDHRLSTYEQWINAFIQNLENILLQQASRESVSQHESAISGVEELPRLSWSSVCENAIQIPTTSTKSRPKRCRDLLLHMNRLLEMSQGFMNPELAQQYFVSTRPTHEWCQLFQLSQDDKVLFKGNSWAIVTHSYFKLYVQWMEVFIKK